MSILSMKKVLRYLCILGALVVVSTSASAQDVYQMTGAAQFEAGHDVHKLPFPVNPQTAGFLTVDDRALTFHYAGHSCNAAINKKINFYVDPVISHSFGSKDKFSDFINIKFHAKGAALTDTYLLGDVDAPLCSGLRFSMIYRSSDEMALVDGSWIYMFQRQTHAPRNAEQSLDCSKAKANVERLICQSPELVRLDGVVNRGYVAMLLTDSKEIAYEDPVRLNQVNWIKVVRNSCDDSSCLLKAYRDRVDYIKGRISKTYPNYPEEGLNQEGD